jgi:sarcosine oxidase subunit delta
MKLMPCPLNGPRNITEFACAGEVKVMPDPAKASDGDWGGYVFLRENAAGVVREWWCHTPTAFWFIAERNTLTDEILRTYPASELFKDRVEFAARDEDGT